MCIAFYGSWNREIIWLLRTTPFGKMRCINQRRTTTYPFVTCIFVLFQIGCCRTLALSKQLTKKVSGNNIQENIWAYNQVWLAATYPANSFSKAANYRSVHNNEEKVGEWAKTCKKDGWNLSVGSCPVRLANKHTESDSTQRSLIK